LSDTHRCFLTPVSELGLATHYIPSSRIPLLHEHLSSLEDGGDNRVAKVIDDLYDEQDPNEPPSALIGRIREALDAAFSGNSVERIVSKLRDLAANNEAGDVQQWATKTLSMIEDRSPTSLHVALQAIRRAKTMSLAEAFKMELGLVSVFCVRFIALYLAGAVD